MVSLALGLLGVALARIVFVDRQNLALGRRQTLRETLPLTLVAMLFAGVIIHDRQLGFSAATFTGLGVGWTAIVLLDVIGRHILGRFDPLAKAPNLLKDTPEDMTDQLRRIDKAEEGQANDDR